MAWNLLGSVVIIARKDKLTAVNFNYKEKTGN